MTRGHIHTVQLQRGSAAESELVAYVSIHPLVVSNVFLQPMAFLFLCHIIMIFHEKTWYFCNQII
ncbi:hypothetical protein HanRHA438_Chr16g0773841 [Helianthus annuus]|nr:hypothetical protein HanRHA438_Chr16g0773841 [Helianthus annuus]